MRKIILVDLDGTLANGNHRVHHILKKPKDWTIFFSECGKDIPISHVIEIINLLSDAFTIYITSGRSDQVREETEKWLKEHNVKYDKLIMRKAGDFTGDDILKVSWLHDGTINQNDVLCVFDDRDRVVKAWREAGLPCFQVAAGEF